MHGGFGLPFWWLGAGLRLLFLGAIVVGGIYLARSFARRGWGRPPEESAREILEKRYARGEISKEEFEEMRRNLG
jgi:putative membrane protein